MTMKSLSFLMRVEAAFGGLLSIYFTNNLVKGIYVLSSIKREENIAAVRI